VTHRLQETKPQTASHQELRRAPPTCVVHLTRHMFCPQCKAEYRPSFSHCSDCEVDLVEHLPVEHSVLAPLEAPEERVWCSDEQESCVYVCAGLSAAGIPFKINEDGHYEIWVPAEFCDKAKAIAGQGCVDFSDSCEDQKIMELPDAGPDFVKHDNQDSSRCTEDASVEIWAEKTEERPWYEPVKGLAWMIELSLHENGIFTHTNVSKDGFQRILVRPEDEIQAREIVREIESGTPPM
jgi:hypothetical protein